MTTDDRGLAALEERLPQALATSDAGESEAGDWTGSEYVMRLAAAILGEHGMFLLDAALLDRLAAAEAELATWRITYRCEMVGCPTIEPHEHGGGPAGREMTAEEREALR